MEFAHSDIRTLDVCKVSEVTVPLATKGFCVPLCVISMFLHKKKPHNVETVAFTDTFTVDRSKRMNAEVYKSILFAYIGPHFITDKSSSKYTAKAAKELFKVNGWNILNWPNQSQRQRCSPHAYDWTKGNA